jgi:hypothetical protein
MIIKSLLNYMFIHIPHLTCFAKKHVSFGGGGVGSYHSGSWQYKATLHLPEHITATAHVFMTEMLYIQLTH